MDGCERARDLILGAEAGALDADEREELTSHLASCEACRAAATSLEGELAGLRRVGEARIEPGPASKQTFLDALASRPRTRPSRRESKRRQVSRGGASNFRYVAVALAAAAMVLVYLSVSGGDDPDSGGRKRAGRRPVETDTTPRVAENDTPPRREVDDDVARDDADDRPAPETQPREVAVPETRVTAVTPRAVAEETAADASEAATAPPAIALVSAADNEEVVRASLLSAINAAAEAGSSATVSLTVGGTSIKGRIASANERGVRLLASRGGFEAVVPWERLEAGKVLELTRTYLTQASLEERLAVARFCVDRGLLEQGRNELRRLASRHADAARTAPVLAVAKMIEDAEARLKEQTETAVAATRDPVLAQPRVALAAAWRGVTSLGSRTYAPATPPRTGYFQDALTDPDTGDETIKYAAMVPASLPATRDLGLVVTFHGAGPSGHENETGMLWLPPIALHRVAKGRFIVVGGRAQKGHWTRSDDVPLTALIDWAVETYPVDPRRIVFLGYSSGATMVKRFGTARDSVAAGIVAIAGSVPRAGAMAAFRRPARVDESPPPFYLVHGDGDELADITATRDERVRLRRQGYRSLLREMRGLGHGDILGSKDMVPVWRDMGVWMNALRGRGRLFDEDLAFLQQAAATPPDDLWNDEDALLQIARIGGPEAGALVGHAMASDSAAVRVMAASACGTVDMGPVVTERLLSLLADPEEVVVRSAVTSLAALARRGDITARDAIAVLVRDTRRDTRTRVHAIEMIAGTLEVQALGRISDVDLLTVLVTCFKDTDETVRTAALDALKSVAPDGPVADSDVSDEARARTHAIWSEWIAREFDMPQR